MDDARVYGQLSRRVAPPDATTENVTDWPAITVDALGCVVMIGGAFVTVTCAALLVTDPAALLTTTV